MATRYQTIDTCREEGCRCEDTYGVILYDGPSREEAEEAKLRARYPDPTVETVGESRTRY